MKIFSAAQIRACDAYTIYTEPIASIHLMERAAGKCMDWLLPNYPKETPFIILCGQGNNGGDGLAITRMLHKEGYSVKAFLLQISNSFSPDCKLNLERLEHVAPHLITTVSAGTFITDVPNDVVIIDAILGTGLSRPVQGWLADFIYEVNELPNEKIAIDIPSGMPADSIPHAQSAIVKVHHTLSFQFFKRAFLHSETGIFAGGIHILDIGLNSTFIHATHTHFYITDSDTIKAIYKPRNPFSHKGTYGSALLIGGSHGKMGAVVLATKAALHIGAGLATALVPACGYTVIQTAIPEAMCLTSGTDYITDIKGWETMKAVGIGIGLGTDAATAKAFELFLDTYKQPLVIDADAINLLSHHPDLLNKVPAHSILTPHPKEFTRLFGESINTMQQVEHARMQSIRYNIFIVLKGHYTVVITPEGECWYNINGNAGMATGGAGDVLTGILTGLLAQGYTPHDAVLMGVYIHGLAGDIAAALDSQEAMLAGDIITSLGRAYQYIVTL